MIRTLKKTVPKCLKKLVKRFLCIFDWDPWQEKTWAQEGEDQILRRIFERERTGFYVDVGAHHPKRFSNTFLFYRRGWHGINIDAMPGSMKLFAKLRPRDINLEVAAGNQAGELDYYIFNEPALNGFSRNLSKKRDEERSGYSIVDVIKVKVEPLCTILNNHLKRRQKIDFMTIDVEGLDLEVLSSNNWDDYRPEYVLVEALGSSLHNISESDVGIFMENVGYEIYAKCVNTVFFKDVSN